MRNLALCLLLPLIAGCATSGPTAGPAPAPARATSAPPPQRTPTPAPSSGGFRAPRVMQMAGLEHVIGRNQAALYNLLGTPRLEVKEGDARKLQYVGEACVLDIYLYPLALNAEPTATYLTARRASDGLDVDRVACVRALSRR